MFLFLSQPVTTRMQLKSGLSNEDFRNWVEVGQALLFLSETLQSHVSREIKSFYDVLKVKVGSATKCYCPYAPGKHNTLSCKWAEAIMSYHRDPATIAWRISDSSKWDDPFLGPSEIVSVYAGEQCMDGIKHLRFLRSCSYFNSSEKIISDAIEVWEKVWGTASNQKLDHEDKFRALDAITKVLYESLFRNNPNTKKTLKDIQSIEFFDLPRLQISELKVARNYRAMLEYKRQKLTQQIMDLDTNLDNVESFLTNMQDPCQRTSAPLHDSLFWLSNFLTVVISFLVKSFVKSRKSQEMLLGFVRFLSLLLHFSCAIVVLVVIMVLAGSVSMIFSLVTSGYVAKLV